MPSRQAQLVQVGKRQLEVSNLTKLLFPQDEISKAQLLEYYLKLAPTVLAHLKGRPLSLVRFPDGIGGESFFQKNMPNWAPEWIEQVTLGTESKNYVLATEPASLAWLANLACIEIHQMHSRAPRYELPDYIVYDLDPPEGFKFPNVIELALEFKEHLESFGYHPFVKTTGRKGLHILTPIEPKAGFDAAFDAAKAMAQPFVDAHPSSLTLHIKKEQRKGRVLLDIYRNRQSQTIVSAYSVRGLPGAPVSTPLAWDELPAIKTAAELNLLSVPERVLQNGDPWEAINAYATPLHTEKAAPRSPRNLKPARTYKTPSQLQEYAKKREFQKTPEPPPEQMEKVPSFAEAIENQKSKIENPPRDYPATPSPHSFVVHRHHASRLHYDLRLEHNGVLRSWAVPKGLPPRPGIMRLAVQVEDHPLEYVDFEGEIPKGEYGGGKMWKFAHGRYEITKQKKDGFYFRLQSRELNGEYRIHNTKENQWLLERVDAPQVDWVRGQVEPMLAQAASSPQATDEFLYEVKWDGIRALIALDEGQLRIYGRNGMDFTKQFPELLNAEASFRATSALFDGEIVCLNADGKPDFQKVIQRMQQHSEGAVERLKAKQPAFCYLFDCLYLDGRPIMNEPLTRRREWLDDAVRTGGVYRVSQAVEDGAAFFKAVGELGLEGILAKKRSSPYLPGKRSDCWLKIKTRQTMECVIVGYTRGKGDRELSFGALHLASWKGSELNYLGKVGTGFDEDLLRQISKELEHLKEIQRPIKERPLDNARSVWLEPRLMCEVQYATITRDGLLREPVFVRLRPDLTAGG